MNENLEMIQQCALGALKYPGLHQKKNGQQGEVGDNSTILLFDSSSGMLCPNIEPPVQEDRGASGENSEESHEDNQSAGLSLLCRKIKGAGHGQLEEELAPWGTLFKYSST